MQSADNTTLSNNHADTKPSEYPGESKGLMNRLFTAEFRPYLLIILLGLLLITAIFLKYKIDINTLQQDFRITAHAESVIVAKSIEHKMNMIYQGLRTIARLPGVREINRSAKHLDSNSQQTIQEIYNNLYTNISLSEIYLVPLGFNPDRVDPKTGELEEPAINFDELIIDRSVQANTSKISSDEQEEIEIHEYRLMQHQLNWFSQNTPTESNVTGLRYPAISTGEVITDDNTYFSPENPNDKDRSGIIYSLPSYDLSGNLTGIVSGVFLTNVLRNMIPNNFSVLSNNNNSYHITPRGKGPWETSSSWYLSSQANPDLIHSEIIELQIPDSRGKWTLWVGTPDEVFWSRPQVKYANRFIAMAFIATVFLIATLFFIATSQIRQRQLIEKQNQQLGNEIAHRTSELEESEAKYQAIITHAADSIITISHDGIIKTLNSAAESVFGFIADEILGKNIDTLIPDLINENGELTINKYISSEPDPQSNKDELVGRHKSESRFPIEANFSEVALDNDSYYIAIVRDITVRKQVEQRIIEAKDSAESSSRTKSEFLANMSHELRTPLNAIIGYSEILQEEMHAQHHSEHINDVKKIMESGKHLLALINNILDLSKIESGKMQLYYEDIDAKDAITEITSTIKPLIKHNSNKLIVNVSDDIGLIQIDITRFRQILFNLLSNASKFTENGTITLTIIKCCLDNKDHIKIVVEDTGIGIEDSQISNIFQDFSQGDNSTTRKFGGTGLGLAITQRFCKLMKGSITAKSIPGEGSIFTVILPVDEKLSEPETFEHVQHEPKADTDPELVRMIERHIGEERRKDISRVLVVDDDPTVHDMMRRMLTKEGFKVYNAHNGEEAIQLASALLPDLITLDIMMPSMDGWSVLRNLKATPALANIPVIMLSMLDEKSMGEALGAVDFVTKPIEKNKIISQIKKYVRTS